MKKLFNLALFGAIALTGAVGFSSCSSSSDEVIDNPNYNPETNTVKTEFTISLPNYVGASTRQTDAITQALANPVFRGLQDMVLIPYDAAVTNESTPFKNKVFTLTDITPTIEEGVVTDEGWDLATQKAKVYRTLDIPINTKIFMFYGHAPIPGTTVDNNFTNGVLNPPVGGFTGTASTYNFTLQQIAGTYNNASDTKGTAIVNYIQAIRQTASLESSELISMLTNFKPTAASSASIQAAVEKLWKGVKAGAYSDGDKAKVKASIEGESNANATISDADAVTLNAANLLGYPANLNLPDGAVTITWNTATPSVPTLNSTAGLDVADLQKFVYPAALYYRANSTIGVSTTEKESENFSSASWADISSNTGATYYTWDGKVDASTRSVAMHDQIQYAVGRLDLKVLTADGTLYDNYGQAVTVNPTDGFVVSAVLVGGQKGVGYDFTPSTFTGTATSYTIYDNVMNNTTAKKVSTKDQGVNRTLVLETAGTAGEKVNVAVEMTNNTGSVFRGKDGDVPIGGKFYLIGTLDLAKTTEFTGSRTKIFEQDYYTTATFTISKGNSAATPTANTNITGLGAAYNVLPDLTVSNLEVAFSVDLTWTQGLTFTVGI